MSTLRRSMVCMSRDTTTIHGNDADLIPPVDTEASVERATLPGRASSARRLVAPDAELDRIADAAREWFGGLVTRDVNPHAAERDAQAIPLPREVMRAAGRLGLLAMAIPEAYGGGGADPVTWGAVL